MQNSWTPSRKVFSSGHISPSMASRPLPPTPETQPISIPTEWSELRGYQWYKTVKRKEAEDILLRGDFSAKALSVVKKLSPLLQMGEMELF